MTTKEYLEQYRKLNSLINAKIREISRLRDIAECVTPRVGGSKVMTAAGEGMAKTVEKRVDLEREVDKMVDDVYSIEETVRCVDDDALQTLLRYRYFLGEPWAVVAINMECTERHVYRLHDKALKKVEDVIECQYT